jgi:ferredoxin
MKQENTAGSMKYLFLILNVIYLIGLGLWSQLDPQPNLWIWLLVFTVGDLIAALPYKSVVFSFELSTLLLTQILFYAIGVKETVFLYLPVTVALLISLGFKFFSRHGVPGVWILSGLWFLWLNPIPWQDLSFAHFLLLAANLLMLLVYTLSIFRRGPAISGKIDVILASYSGNTAHFTKAFTDGAQAAGAAVEIHRFHYHRQFQANLAGAALVIAFPVFGCKPPRSLLYYLMFKLPCGHGKPAFIIYTCIGGSENADFLVWLILTLKGYRVAGKSGSVYPLNVPVIRLGPAKLWERFDAGMTPGPATLEAQKKAGADFALGQRAGRPVIFYLTPLFIIGTLLENKYLSMLNRNRVNRKRCTQCGFCVRYCPEQRLQMVDGYPKCRGSCSICLGCVNLCPTGAMGIARSQIGNPYHPKWRELTLRSLKLEE